MTILYFAWVKEKIGLSQEAVAPPPAIVSVGDLMDWLATRSGAHAAAFAERRMIKAAVDQVHAGPATAIAGAAEIAFFPPVTGG